MSDKFNSQWLHEYQAKINSKRVNTQFQKQQDDLPRKVNHKPKEAKKDGGDHPKFRITIKFKIADNRRRDIDGMQSTILDCLTRTYARRRLLAMGTTTKFYGREIIEGR